MEAAGVPTNRPFNDPNGKYELRDGSNVNWQGALRGAEEHGTPTESFAFGETAPVMPGYETVTSPGRYAEYGARAPRSVLPTYEY